MPSHQPRRWDPAVSRPDLLPSTGTVAAGLTALLGAWLIVAPWALGFDRPRAIVVEMATGAALVALAALGLRHPGWSRRAACATAVAGLWLVAAGAVLGHDAVVRLDEVLIGGLVTGLAAVAVLVD